MSAQAWDCIGKRHVEIGARRWGVEWWTWRDGHGGAVRECEDHFMENCQDAHEQRFPNRGLAVAFARKVSRGWQARPGPAPRMAGGARVCEEVFEAEHSSYGSWERVGEYEEVL